MFRGNHTTKSLLLGMGLCCFLLFCFFPTGHTYAESEVEKQIDSLRKQVQELHLQYQREREELERKYGTQMEMLEKRIDELEARLRNREKGHENEERSAVASLPLEEGPPAFSPSPQVKVLFSSDFPTYFRTRVRLFSNGTFVGAVPGENDEVFFVDSRLLVSPMVKVGGKLSIRSQLDIAKNIIWGGLTNENIAQKVFEAPSPSDSFRGALLREVTNPLSGEAVSPVDEDEGFFNLRSLYVVAEVPVGELWIGRQPFDWGLGILNNAGSMPDQDLGSIVDRFEFDTAPLALVDERWEKLLFFFAVDRLAEGLSVSGFNEGDGWEIGGGIYYQGDNLNLGGYLFSVYQNNFDLSGGLGADVNPAINWSLYLDYKSDHFRVAFEFQDLVGKIDGLEAPLPDLLGSRKIDITPENFLLVARVEFYPRGDKSSVVAIESGWSNGDDARTPDKLEGGGIFFNNAFVIDNLLFKHMIPTVYGVEGSVINSWYLRTWARVGLSDSLHFTPQVVVAWVDERNALGTDLLNPLPPVRRLVGTELEGTLTWKVIDGMWFDFIGSAVIAGGGLDDLLSQRAFIEGVVPTIDSANPPGRHFAFQGRLIVTVDGLIKNWMGSSTFMPRWF